jgi:hypothetical protein
MYQVLNSQQSDLQQMSANENAVNYSSMYRIFVSTFIVLFLITLVVMLIIDTRSTSKRALNNRTSLYLNSTIIPHDMPEESGIVYASYIIPKAEVVSEGSSVNIESQQKESEGNSLHLNTRENKELPLIQTTTVINVNGRATHVNGVNTPVTSNTSSVNIDINSSSSSSNASSSFTNLNSISSTHNNNVSQFNSWNTYSSN